MYKAFLAFILLAPFCRADTLVIQTTCLAEDVVVTGGYSCEADNQSPDNRQYPNLNVGVGASGFEYDYLYLGPGRNLGLGSSSGLYIEFEGDVGAGGSDESLFGLANVTFFYSGAFYTSGPARPGWIEIGDGLIDANPTENSYSLVASTLNGTSTTPEASALLPITLGIPFEITATFSDTATYPEPSEARSILALSFDLFEDNGQGAPGNPVTGLFMTPEPSTWAVGFPLLMLLLYSSVRRRSNTCSPVAIARQGGALR